MISNAENTAVSAKQKATAVQGLNAVADIVADHYQIERASAYRRKCRAVDKLTVLLFGK